MKCKFPAAISHADLKDVNWSQRGLGCGVEAKRGCQLAGLVPVCVPGRHYLTQYRTGQEMLVELDFVTRPTTPARSAMIEGE
jgi:hypothetical protein